MADHPGSHPKNPKKSHGSHLTDRDSVPTKEPPLQSGYRSGGPQSGGPPGESMIPDDFGKN
jgi:hypothetical protein